MFILLPLKVDVPMSRWPYANFIIIGLTVITFFCQNAMSVGTLENMILSGFSLPGLLTHILLHADFFHLLGNMLFLWIFGNAVCAKVGNIAYAIFYILGALCAALCHNLFSPAPAIGASGAVSAVVGAYVLLFPLNDITCFTFLMFRGKVFAVSSMWIVGLWLFLDIYGAIYKNNHVAYMAHVGGWVFGIATFASLLWYNKLDVNETERTLFDVWGIDTPSQRMPPEESLSGEEIHRMRLDADAHRQKTEPKPKTKPPSAPTPESPPLALPTDPATQRILRVTCPNDQCSAKLKAQVKSRTRTLKCPKCQTAIPLAIT